MILATSLGLLPVALVAIMTTHELRPWRHRLKQIRGLPEHPPPQTTLTNPAAIPSKPSARLSPRPSHNPEIRADRPPRRSKGDAQIE
jgi:hypothetical protein